MNYQSPICFKSSRIEITRDNPQIMSDYGCSVCLVMKTTQPPALEEASQHWKSVHFLFMTQGSLTLSLLAMYLQYENGMERYPIFDTPEITPGHNVDQKNLILTRRVTT